MKKLDDQHEFYLKRATLLLADNSKSVTSKF